MNLITNSPKGTNDILPEQSYKWNFVEDVMKSQAQNFGFKGIRTPVFEHTELFLRSVGSTSDVVQKEMYTFLDKGERSITLRPEGTAGAIRSILEHGLHNQKLPVKVSYLTSCYRYEKPQAGRQREFNQFGVEVVGPKSPICDAEVVLFAKSVFDRLNIDNLSLEINSIGCPECRAKYNQALIEYFEAIKDQLCKTCHERLEKNPMRLLDCKSEICGELAKNAPSILDYLCEECSEHFETLKNVLDEENVKYSVNPRIVRGLDYYTKTVFEFVSNDLGTQSTVCAGGRYDGLIEELSGESIPAIGLAFGIERVLMILDKLEIEIPDKRCDVFIASSGDKAKRLALNLAGQIRDMSLIAECDLMDRSVRSQMKYADKIGAKFSFVIGDDEIENGVVNVKNMITGDKREIKIDDSFVQEFAKMSLSYIPMDLETDLDGGIFNE